LWAALGERQGLGETPGVDTVIVEELEAIDHIPRSSRRDVETPGPGPA
jgi:hypothetical protein